MDPQVVYSGVTESRLAGAWQDERAWTGVTRAGGVHLPGEIAGKVAVNEVVVHGWDIAAATGHDYNCEPELLLAAYAFLQAAVAQNPNGSPGCSARQTHRAYRPRSGMATRRQGLTRPGRRLPRRTDRCGRIPVTTLGYGSWSAACRPRGTARGTAHRIIPAQPVLPVR